MVADEEAKVAARLSPEPVPQGEIIDAGYLERSLRALTKRAVNGLPGIEKSCCLESIRLLEEADGDIERAVDLCADMGGRGWTDATARFVVGFVPFVGGMGLQLEQMWLQIRVLAIIAALYGHDVDTPTVQQQLILCLMDAVTGQAQAGKLRSEMERVALTQICKKLVLGMTGCSTLGRRKGQLPPPPSHARTYKQRRQQRQQQQHQPASRLGSAGGLYNAITGTVRGQWSGGRPPPELIDRAKKHFRPSSKLFIGVTQMTGIILACLVSAKLVTVAKLVAGLPDKIFKGLPLSIVFRFFIMLLELMVLVPAVAAAGYGLVKFIKSMPAGIPVIVFGGLGLLQALVAYNMTLDFIMFWQYIQTAMATAMYHAHKAGYGIASLVCMIEDAKTGRVSPEAKTVKTMLQVALGWWFVHALIFGMEGHSTLTHVSDIIALICQHMFLERLRQFDILVSAPKPSGAACPPCSIPRALC